MPACVRLDDLRISCGLSTSPRQIGILRCNQLPPTVAPGVHIEKAQSKVEKLRALAALQLADRLGAGSRVVTVQVDSGVKYLNGPLYR